MAREMGRSEAFEIQNGGKSGWKQWEAVRFDSVQFDEYDRVGDSRFKLEPGSADLKFPPHSIAPSLRLSFIRRMGGRWADGCEHPQQETKKVTLRLEQVSCVRCERVEQ